MGKYVALAFVVLLFLAALFSYAWSAPVFPEPKVTDHTWIQANKEYRLREPSAPTHCCGREHCRMLNKGQVIRADDGYVIMPSPPFIHKTQFFPESSVYYTEAEGEGEYWACVIGGKVRCLFVPPLGF